MYPAADGFKDAGDLEAVDAAETAVDSSTATASANASINFSPRRIEQKK